MDTCDAVIVGGGPAGSTCARHLHAAGLDVVVVDKALFPRDKVCAGWITPQVIEDVDLDMTEYRKGRTFQPITSFAVGVIDREETVHIDYERPVSYGIRRCEFDAYLLERSGARLSLGTSVSTIRREGALWILNDQLAAPMLVGAGGHFCPVARHVGGDPRRTQVVAAREVEFVIDDPDAVLVSGSRPELYFCRDLSGYGWCFRKQDHLNVGFGRLDARALPASTDAFVTYLQKAGRLSAHAAWRWRWRGHAYLLAGPARRVAGDGFVLIGDAAGLAYPESGEGIRPAVESGAMAASAIVRAAGRYSEDRLAIYARELRHRFGRGGTDGLLSRVLPAQVLTSLANRLLHNTRFVRHLVLDRWFLHAQQPALRS
jgi:geranylgeranyl reductase family protein